MTPRAVNSRHSIESCILQLHAWKPFDPYPFNSKKPCRSDRSTAPNPTDLDLSKLSLLDDPPKDHGGGGGRSSSTHRWLERKRRRRGSRSVSGRSSDRSGTHRRASAAYATCSDFPLAGAGATDSSGELFGNGEGGSWGSDVNASEVRVSRKEIGTLVGERESGYGLGIGGVMEVQGNELSGYGSEPGYRGDGELGDGDELDEEEEDGRLMFWGNRFGGGRGDTDRMEIIGENQFSEQKMHHRCRRKKQDWRIVAPLR